VKSQKKRFYRTLQKYFILVKNIFMKNRRKLPRLSRLKIFEVAAIQLKFSKAALDLDVTQSAVSQQVRLLEDELDIKLFDRLNHGLKLTKGGRLLLNGISEAFNTIEKATEDAMAVSKKPELIVGTTFSVATFWLLKRLENFRNEHPSIKINLISTDKGFEDIADQIDVGIAFGKGIWSGLKSTHILRPKIFPVGSPKYINKINSPIDLVDLAKETLLTIEKEGKSRGEEWNNWFSELSVDHAHFKDYRIFNSHSLLVQATCQGQGISLGWSLLTDDLIDEGKLLKITDAEIQASIDFYYVEDQKKKSYSMKVFKNWFFNTIKAENLIS
jgi:LysR family glycine cleavage system transcriptional activator